MFFFLQCSFSLAPEKLKSFLTFYRGIKMKWVPEKHCLSSVHNILNLLCQELKCLMNLLSRVISKYVLECWQTTFHTKHLHDLYHEW